MRTLIGLFIVLILATSFGPAFAVEQDRNQRKALYIKDKDEGFKTLGKRQIHCFNKRNLEFDFSILGGPFEGSETFHIVSVFTIEKIGLDQLLEVEGKYRLEGEFEGGDGGEITGRKTDLEDNTSTSFTGRLNADGTGYILFEGDKEKTPLRFEPFEGCDTDLNSYEKALRSELFKKLMDLASKKLFDDLVLVMNTAGDTAYSMVAGSKYLNAGQKVKLSDAKKMWDRLSNKANQLAPDNVLQLLQEITTALAVIEAADAAIDGAYQDAAKIAALEFIALKSNAAGLMIVAGQAAKADWDAFCQRWNEQQFRKFYRDLYYDGERPKGAADFLDKPNRLRGFMELALDYLSANDSIRGRPFRKMLIDYASINLNLSYSYSDFDVIESKGKLKMVNRDASTVLGALFNDYEQVYINDLRAEKLRRIAMEQSLPVQQELKRMNSALAWASNGNFKEVWDEKTFQSIFCGVLAELQQMKLTK